MASLLSWLGKEAKQVGQDIGLVHRNPTPAPAPPLQASNNMSVGVAQPQGRVSVASPPQQPRVNVAAPQPQVPRVSIAPAAPQILTFNGQRYNNTTAAQAPNTTQYDAMGAYDKLAHGALGFPGAVYRNVIKPLPGGFVNTGKLPIRVGQLAGTEIVHGPNSTEAGQALQNLSDTYQQSIPNGMVTPAWHAVQAVEQTPVGNPVWQAYNKIKQNQKNQQAAQADAQVQSTIHKIQQGVESGQIDKTEAANAIDQLSKYSQAYSQNKEAGYNRAFINAGFNPNDSPFTIGRKFVSNAGQTVGNVATLGAATEAQPAETALGRLLSAANNSGKFMAASNTLAALGQDQVKPIDLVKAPVTGYLQGAALAAALHPADIVQGTGEIASKVDKVAPLATPEMRINIADQNILRDYTDMLSGSNPAKGKELSDLIGQTQQIGKKYGVDLTNGSKVERLDRAAGILDQIGQKNRDLTASGSIKNPFYRGGPEQPPGTPPPETPQPESGSNAKGTSSKSSLAEQKLNQLAEANRGSQGSEMLQHGAAMNDYLFSKSPFSNGGEVAKATKGMAKLEGIDKATNQTADSTATRLPKLAPAKVEPPAQQAIGLSDQSLSGAKDVLSGLSPNAKNSMPKAAPQRATTTKSQLPLSSIDNGTPFGPVTPLKERGFTTSVKSSSNFSKDLRTNISQNYAMVTDKTTIANTQKFLKQPFNRAYSDVLDRLQSSKSPDKQLVNDAGTVMQILDAKGKTADAQHIHDLLSEHLTNSGQVSQAASLLLRRSPDGIYHKAITDLKKGGIEVTKTIDDHLKSLRENIRSTLPDTTERDIAVQQMKQFVAKNIPSKLTDKVFAVWRAGLLSGPRTVAKIVTSHGVQIPLEELKNIPAAVVDRLASLVTGQRSLVNTTKGLGKGFAEGVHAGFSKQGYLRSGIDVQPGSNAVEFHNQVNFGNSVAGKAAEAYANGIGRLHGSLYKPFYGAIYENSLFSQAKAAAVTAGLKGEEASNFVQDFVKSPSKDAMDIATNDAEHATFQQKTALGQGASAIQKIPVAGRYIAPFTRIPSAIVSDMLDYSPVGAIKTIAQGIQNARADHGWTVADQRIFSQGLGRSITGTAALLPGYMLYNRGMMTLQYPSDPNEQKLWALQGKKENSVLIGGKWRQLGSLGPVGAVLSLGGGLAAGKQEGKKGISAGVVAAGQGVKSIADQPYVSGLSMAANAINDPGRYLTSLEKQYAGSIIPTGIAQVASAGDGLTRKTNTSGDTIKSKIPGLRETLTPSKNAFGGNIPNGESGPAAVIDPFYSSNNLKTDATIQELERLNSVGNGTMPSAQPQKNSFNGVKVDLTKPQAQALSARIGQAVKPLWDQTISSPQYQALSDDRKHQALSNILSDTSSAIKDQYAQENKLGQYAVDFNGKAGKLSAKQQVVANNSFNPQTYTSGSVGSGITLAPGLPKQYADTLNRYSDTTIRQMAFNGDPSAEYQYNLAKYQNDKANGALSTAQDITTQKALAKQQVGSVYPKNVRDLYDLSKTDLNNYLTTSEPGVDKQKIADQLIAYDRSLASAGIISKAKFATGVAATKSASKGSSRSKGSTTANKASLSKYASILKSANAAIKPPTMPKSPGITVKRSGPAATYKQAPLRQFAVAKYGVTRGKKA